MRHYYQCQCCGRIADSRFDYGACFVQRFCRRCYRIMKHAYIGAK